MKTEIFSSYNAFLTRPDKTVNGILSTHQTADSSLDAGSKGCWNCFFCKNCTNCSDCRFSESINYCTDCESCKNCSNCESCHDCNGCIYCIHCRNCIDCLNCKNCNHCENCRRNFDCIYCGYCEDYSYAKDIPKDAQSICLKNLYKYITIPRINKDKTQWIQLGCFLRTREAWEQNFWNNSGEFLDDKSVASEKRMLAFKIACLWLDYQSKFPSQ